MVAADVHRITVSREGELWLADGPGNAHTFARDPASLDRHVREAVALALDLPASAELTLVLEYSYPDHQGLDQ